MTPLAFAISRALIHFVWEGAIVGLALWVVLYVLRRQPASWRYIASCAALLLLAVMPLATAWTVYSWSAGSNVSTPAAVTVETASAALTNVSNAAVWLNRLQNWALPLWSLGVLVFSTRMVLGYRHAFLLRRRGAPASSTVIAVVERLTRAIGVGRPVRVLISSMLDSPSVIGWLRPVILLSASTLMGLTPLQFEAILAHEIAHIKRYDYLVNMLQMLVETLLFYHPAVWWASRRIRIERELCCDDVAVQFSGNALRYARALTIIEKLRLTAPNVAMASTGGSLLYRIQRLVGVPEKEYGTSRLPTVLALCAGILCLAMNVSWISAQDAPGVKVDLGSSSVIHRTPVQYPESAQKQKITGTVQVEVKLDASGDVADARVLTGPEELRKAALQSVLGWHFTSDAARSTRTIQISFSDRGTAVQVGEPYTFQGQTVVLADEAKRLELAKIAKIELTRAEEAQINKEQEAELATVRAQRQQLELQMKALRAQMEATKAADRDGLDPKITEIQLKSLEAQLAAVKAQFDSTQPLIAKVVPVGSVVANRTLKGIATPGLSDSARNDLISKLPVRVGDVLSEATLKQTDAAIRAYDEHLVVQFLATPDGQAEIRVSAPGRR